MHRHVDKGEKHALVDVAHESVEKPALTRVLPYGTFDPTRCSWLGSAPEPDDRPISLKPHSDFTLPAGTGSYTKYSYVRHDSLSVALSVRLFFRNHVCL